MFYDSFQRSVTFNYEPTFSSLIYHNILFVRTVINALPVSTQFCAVQIPITFNTSYGFLAFIFPSWQIKQFFFLGFGVAVQNE